MPRKNTAPAETKDTAAQAQTPDGPLPIDLKVTITPVNKDNLMAFAKVVLNDQFKVPGFKVVNGEKGLFVDNPATQGKDGNWYQNCYAITPEFRNQLHTAILDEYTATIDRLQQTVGAAEKAIQATPPKQSLTKQVDAIKDAQSPAVAKAAPARDVDVR